MTSKKINILIVSYFFAPDKRVGALRTSYWYKTLPQHLNCNVEVLTGNVEAKGDGVYVIPKTGEFSNFSLIKDDGLLWKKNIKSFLEKNIITIPDIVIMSGSPFMHFSLSRFFKKKYSCKVILDYRDPFSLNPAFNSSAIRIFIKQFFERKFNKSADALITVNEYCGNLIQLFHEKPSKVIQNGFDDTFQPVLKEVSLLKPIFSYPGKFYLSLDPFLESLSELNLQLLYAGPDDDKLDLDKNKNIFSLGFTDYSTSVQMIADSDVGIIQINALDFQSTTKIYDYIRCQKAIMIVSNNSLERGSVYDELIGYPNVYWTKNEKASIIETITKIINSRYIIPDKSLIEKYSRKNQMKKLIELIHNLRNE